MTIIMKKTKAKIFSLTLALLFVCCGNLVLVDSTSFAQEQTWKINLKNADINEFITQVASITGKTFVVDPRVKGQVTVISNTSLDKEGIFELFLAVLRVHGFATVYAGDIIKIQQQQVAKQGPSPRGENVEGEQMITRVIGAQNVDAAELVKILRPMIPQFGHIAAVSKPNVVIISDYADNIDRLKTIIQQIDVADEDEVVMVPLKEAYVGSLVQMLEKVAPAQIGRGAKGPQSIQVIANERNNSLVIRGKPRPVGEVLKLIEKLDQPATSSGATQVIRLKYADAVNVAEILNGLMNDRSTEENSTNEKTNIQADESLNAIVARADPTSMNEITDTIRQLDLRRTQVLIEAAIVEVSLSKNTDVGFDLAGVDAANSAIPLFSTALSSTLGPLINSLSPDANGVVPNPIQAIGTLQSPTVAVAKIAPDSFSFGAVLQALVVNTEANLLSTPSIMTLDNEEASIVVGQEVPFRTGSFTTTTDGASNPFTTIQRQNVGLTLTVTPHIHEGNSLRLEVSLESSSVLNSGLSSGQVGFSDVVTNKRTLDNAILADNRQTIVLGGLISDDITDTTRKVPLLGDIPLLGKLFQNKSKSKTKRNLLIFLRPTILESKADVAATTEKKYSDIWEIEIHSAPKKNQIPPIDSLYEGRP